MCFDLCFFFSSCSCSFDDAPLSLSTIINSKKILVISIL
jgi:hypothetical protein